MHPLDGLEYYYLVGMPNDAPRQAPRAGLRLPDVIKQVMYVLRALAKILISSVDSSGSTAHLPQVGIGCCLLAGHAGASSPCHANS
jgi:hypothetical protein